MRAAFSFIRDQAGSVLVEFTVLLPIFFLLVLGSVDFLLAMYQWNAAAKAVQLGARIAATSTPVATGLRGLSTAVLGGTVTVGDSMPSFAVTCNGATTTCACIGTCTGVSGYSSSAMNTIVYGRGSTSCGDATANYHAGMCDIFPRIAPVNVSITYEQTGMGYAGRPDGPVPTVTVKLQNLTFQLYFAGALLPFNSLTMPAMTTTITGEDLCSVDPDTGC